MLEANINKAAFTKCRCILTHLIIANWYTTRRARHGHCKQYRELVDGARHYCTSTVQLLLGVLCALEGNSRTACTACTIAVEKINRECLCRSLHACEDLMGRRTGERVLQIVVQCQPSPYLKSSFVIRRCGGIKYHISEGVDSPVRDSSLCGDT